MADFYYTCGNFNLIQLQILFLKMVWIMCSSERGQELEITLRFVNLTHLIYQNILQLVREKTTWQF